jgi:tRNA threonylcarbamoyladenosine biosynthesis protein TsaB
MLVLALDTSTLWGSVGWICTDDGTFAECTAPARPGHAETLLPRIETVLSFGGYGPEDIGLIAFGRGPGTFTGLRIGLASVKGLALGRGVPVVGISSLEALAFSARLDGLIACAIDAKRKELFGGLYRVKFADGLPNVTPVLGEWIGPAADVIAKLVKETKNSKDVFVTGNGIAVYKSKIIEAFKTKAAILPEQSWATSAYWMAKVGLDRFDKHGSDDLDSIEPKYLREPDARLPGGR